MIRAAALAFVLSACPVWADERTVAEVASDAAEDLAQAALALRAADTRRDRVAALTETVRAYEAGLSALREGLRRGAIRERSLRARFEAEEARLSQLTGVLLAMRGSPEALLLLHPAGPTETARAGMLVSSVAPGLQAEVDDLRARLEGLRDIQAVQRNAAEVLSAGLEGVAAARTALSQAIAARTPLPARVADDPGAIQALINSAETLDAFAGGLAAIGLPASTVPDARFADARGALPWPVAGVTLRRFGEADAAGVERPGLVVATRPLALVSAPWPATIRYAGPLLDYGNVIILEPENGYLLVLAGLAQLYAKAGEVIDAGAPLGTMGGNARGADEILAETVQGGGQDRTETLYIELRQDQMPQDPQAWFAAAAQIGPTE